jgi:hypothetical protein
MKAVPEGVQQLLADPATQPTAFHAPGGVTLQPQLYMEAIWKACQVASAPLLDMHVHLLCALELLPQRVQVSLQRYVMLEQIPHFASFPVAVAGVLMLAARAMMFAWHLLVSLCRTWAVTIWQCHLVALVCRAVLSTCVVMSAKLVPPWCHLHTSCGRIHKSNPWGDISVSVHSVLGQHFMDRIERHMLRMC